MQKKCLIFQQIVELMLTSVTICSIMFVCVLYFKFEGENMDLILDEKEKKEYCKVLSDDLPVLRAKLGITQEELAIRVGKSRNMIAQIETGKKEMAWGTFVALSLMFLSNETTAAVFKSLNIFDEKVEKFLMFGNHSEV